MGEHNDGIERETLLTFDDAGTIKQSPSLAFEVVFTGMHLLHFNG